MWWLCILFSIQSDLFLNDEKANWYKASVTVDHGQVIGCVQRSIWLKYKQHSTAGQRIECIEFKIILSTFQQIRIKIDK